MFAEDRRSQTLRLLLRLLEIVEGDVLSSSDLPALLNFDHRVADDPFVASLDAYPAWMGVILRAWSVEAWRNLSAWLVSTIGGNMSLPALGQEFADQLPNQTVGSFRDELPATSDNNSLLPAELNPDILTAETPVQCLAI